LDLSQAVKSFAVFYFSKFKKAQKIEKQKDLDKKMVARLGGRKWPKWKQLKRLPTTLNRLESIAIKVLIMVVVITGGFLFYNGYYKNLITVPKNGGDMTEGLIGSPLYLNPILAYSDVDKDISRLIFSGLMKYNEKLEPMADLAEKYEISEDQKVYTFYLKHNIKWHDSKDLTASDVVFTITSIQNPDYKSPLYRSFNGIIIDKIDDYTVKFTLEQPYAAFLNLLTVGIIPQHIWYDTTATNAKLAIYNQRPVGSGPYKFKNLVKENRGLIKSYSLEKNKDYYGKAPYINNIYFKFYPDYESAVEGLINKEVKNLSFLPKEYLKKVSKRDLNLNNIDLAQYTALFFNSKNNALLSEKKVREALAYAIDKNKIIEDVLQGQGQAIDSPILKNFIGYNSEIKKYEYNPKKALEILTGDGWIIDKELLKKKGNDLKITLTTVDQVENVKVANLLKDFWASIGVNVELQLVAKDKIESEIITPRNYQILLYGEILGYDPDLFPFWHSSQRETPGLNLANYSNRKVDQLLEEARQTNDNKVREAKYLEFQNLLIEDLPAIFLFSPDYIYPVSKKVQGISAEKIALPSDRFINIENWYIKTKKQFFK
jgi:peptide/nickel transport system substrate-binding protein